MTTAAALLIVPPFAGVDRPSLAAHLLQACARRAGFEVAVFYANLYLAKAMGRELYESISYAPTYYLLGERFFAGAAYGKTALSAESIAELRKRTDLEFEIDVDALLGWHEQAGRIADELAAIVVAADYPIAGFSTTFEQTSASLAILNRVKTIRPGLIAIAGGANCEGPMAAGILTLSANIDYVFAGESEASFVRFLQGWKDGSLPAGRIVAGEATFDLDALPLPDYREYYDQVQAFLPELAESGDVWLPYESSRGCWWGAKHHCTFCGLNAGTMAHRAKSGSVALEQLQTLLAAHPSRKAAMVDNIMPHEYFRTFLPRVKEALGDVHMFYEEKANLSLEQVLLLKSAGVNVIQPGIESLSTPVLALMDKGVTARKNLELLRFARAAELALNWNILLGFPGDRAQDYWDMAALIPALVHLNPPSGVFGLSIDRFSPYFERPERYGIRAMRPMASYFDVLPDGADVFGAAYHFTGDYDSESLADGEMQKALREAVERWRSLWRQDERAAPALAVTPVDGGIYMLLDSRFDAAEPAIEFIDEGQARLVLSGEGDGLQWARDRRYIVKVDGRWTPLATADVAVMAALGDALKSADA